MKRVFKGIISFGMAFLLLSGCGVSDVTEQKQEDEDDTIEIGMCFDSFVIERWQKDRDIFVATATGLGATVNVQNANGDVDKQIEQIEYLVDKGVDCLVIIPIDGESLGPAVQKAKDKGIPVVSYDRLIKNADTDLYISFDNEAVGIMMGEAIASTGATSVVMICGPLTDNNVPMVNAGFVSVMEKNGIEILDIYYCDNWRAELGGSYIYDNIDTVRSADAIMCGNDDVANSVIRSLAVCQLAGITPVVGQDADLIACQHIVEGTQTMTVYKPVSVLAENAASLAFELASGRSISEENVINDGSYKVPYVAINPVAVDLANIDEIIIDGGYHTRDDVYLNVAEHEEEALEEQEPVAE